MRHTRPSPRLRTLSLCLPLLVLGLACQSTPEPAPPPPPPPPPVEPMRQPPPPPPRLDTVYFDFDSAVIRDDARSTLRQNSDALRGSQGVVTLEGHCDERGSEEYNLALGDRRANAVRSYLVNLGIPNSRLRVVSFGEAKPAVMGHDESAWRWNRRVEFRTDAR